MTARNWCFTAYNEPREIYHKEKIIYMIYQEEECPKTGAHHWQGYIELTEPVRMSMVKEILDDNTVHLERRKGTREEARAYCEKTETQVKKPVEIGEWRDKTQGARNDLKEVKKIIDEGGSVDQIIDNAFGSYVKYHRGIDKVLSNLKSRSIPPFRKVEVITYWGVPGCGKTRAAFAAPGRQYVLFSTDPLWFDGYTGEDTLILDDFEGDIKYDKLLRILDGYKMQWPVKGGSIWAEWTTVIITSNKPPVGWYPNRAECDALTRRTGVPPEFTGVN